MPHFAMRLLLLDEAAIAQLERERPGSFAYRLPRASYVGQNEALPTLAVSSLLLGTRQLTSQEAEQLVSQLFARNRQWLQYGSVQGSQLVPGNAQRGLGVPLHEGAEKALRQLTPASPPAG